MDLHPGEEVLYDGHPSWRSTLGFYIVGFLGAVAAGVVAGVLVDTAVGVIVVVAALLYLVFRRKGWI